VRMPQDPGAAGKADAETKVKLLKGYPVVVKPISGDKATRARPASAQAEAGNVKLLRGRVERHVPDEVCAFPNGSFDDQVDAFADALNELALGQQLQLGQLLMPRPPLMLIEWEDLQRRSRLDRPRPDRPKWPADAGDHRGLRAAGERGERHARDVAAVVQTGC
jgi:hypothetical protein